MLDFLVNLDESLFLYLNGLGVSFWDSFWLYLSRTLSGITLPLYFFLLLVTYKTYGLKKALIAIVIAIFLLFLTEFLSIITKNEIGRLRPCYNESLKYKMRLIKSYCGSKFGYFSAHACNSFALATFFGVLFKKKIFFLVLVIWAFLVSYSRIYIGVHFPLDVITGIVIGVFFGVLFSTFFFKLISRKLNINSD